MTLAATSARQLDAAVMADDERFMRTWRSRWRGAASARPRRTPPSARSSCVMTPITPVIVGRGVTAAGGRPHAERIALDQAGELAIGATLYVTLEPCARRSILRDGPSCTDAVLCSGLSRIVIGAPDPSPYAAGEGVKRLKAHGIVVENGTCKAEARILNLGHELRVTQHRPMVLLKLAMTADGFAGSRQRAPLAITGDAAKARTFLMRAEADAIAVGIGTVLADDPALTCRLPGLEARSPIRIVFDTDLRLPQASRLASTARTVPTWVFAGLGAPAERERALLNAGVEVMRVGEDKGRLDLGVALGLLADRGITRLMVEGGPAMAEEFRGSRADRRDGAADGALVRSRWPAGDRAAFTGLDRAAFRRRGRSARCGSAADVSLISSAKASGHSSSPHPFSLNSRPFFALPIAFLRRLALVGRVLALGERDLDLRPALLVEIDLQWHHGHALALGRHDQPADLALVQQQFARPLRLMIETVGLQVFGDIGVDEIERAALLGRIALTDRTLAAAQGFDLRAGEHDARLEGLADLVGKARLPVVGDDLRLGLDGCHGC